MSKKYFIFIYLFGIFLPALSFASAHVNNRCSEPDSIAVHAAIVNYLDKNSGIPSQDVAILKMQCFNHYASAIIHPKKPVTDDATVYLHKNKKWEVLSIGTDFDKDLLKRIPKRIRTY